jgi:hypothetical protein
MAKALTFRGFMARRAVTDDPEGDFTADWRLCNRRSNPQTLPEMLGCMGPLANSAAREAARRVWKEFLQAGAAVKHEAQRQARYEHKLLRKATADDLQACQRAELVLKARAKALERAAAKNLAAGKDFGWHAKTRHAAQLRRVVELLAAWATQ